MCWRTDRWVPPTERAGSEGVIEYRVRYQVYCIPECKKGAPLRGRLYKRVVFASLKGEMEKSCIPESKRVHAPFGARVLSVMSCALTDGFGPGTAAPSGLVQRGVIMPPVGGSRGAAIKLIAREGDTIPFEPSEPSRPKDVSMPSRRLVFITDCFKYGMYRDSSPEARIICRDRGNRFIAINARSKI